MPLRRAVGNIKAAIVLRALDEPAFDKSVRQVRVGVGANPVRGKKLVFGGAVWLWSKIEDALRGVRA